VATLFWPCLVVFLSYFSRRKTLKSGKIHLRPELEEMIKKDVQRGPYQTVNEFVGHAISLLHEQEAWLAEYGTEIQAKIEQGYAAAQLGELIDSDQVRSMPDERKRAWLAEKRQV
jgi:putative addiction module CopG family antidote